MARSNWLEWDFNNEFEELMNLFLLVITGRRKYLAFKEAVLPLALLLYLKQQNAFLIKDTADIDETKEHVIIRVKNKYTKQKKVDISVCCDNTVIEGIQNEDFKDLFLKSMEKLRNINDSKGFMLSFFDRLLDQKFNAGDALAIFDRAMKEVYRINEDATQPHELSLLVSHLVDKKVEKIYDPFGGFMDFATTMPDKHFVASEINEFTRDISLFRLALAGIIDHSESYFIGAEDWMPGKFDAIVTFPPFACKLDMEEDFLIGPSHHTDVDLAVLERFDKTTNKQGQLVMVVPLSTLTRETSEIKNYRELFVKKNWLDTVVILPNNIFKSTQVSTAIIVLKKDRKKDDAIRLVDASKCSFNKGIRNVLDVEKALKLLDYSDGIQSVEVSKEEILKHNSSWLVGWYLYLHNVKFNKGDEVKPLSDILELVNSPRKTGECDGHLVSVDALLRSNPIQFEFEPEDFAKSEDYELISSNVIRVAEPAILISYRGTSFPLYCKASEDNPIFVKSMAIGAYSVKDKSVHIGYLCGELYRRLVEMNKFVSAYLYKNLLGSIQLSIPSIDIQASLCEESKKVAQEAKLNELGLLNVIDGYKKQVRERKHQLMQNTLTLAEDWKDLKEYLCSNDGKFNEQDTIGILNPVSVADLIISVSENISIIERKVNHLTDSDFDWGKNDEINIQKFIGEYIMSHKSTQFRFEFEEKKSIIKQWFDKGGNVVLQESEPDWLILIPHNALRQVFDNIVSNAKSHGFLKKENSYYIIRFDYYYDFDKIILDISNNGEPLKDGVDTDYIRTYGKSTGTNTAALEVKEHDGGGGDEIDAILKKYNADFEVLSTPDESYTVTYRITFNNITNNGLLLDENHISPDKIDN